MALIVCHMHRLFYVCVNLCLCHLFEAQGTKLGADDTLAFDTAKYVLCW